ncbi:MAG: desulfoferrodoxin [Clostridia bacterium]|nr:desulfoferrodoxin [Clostridia bacterium]
MREFTIKKCSKCGAIIKVINDCQDDNCEITCCGEAMKTVIPNSVDAAVEKHVPTYEVDGKMINIKVNHVMDDDHYIEWVSIVTNGKECISYFKPGVPAETHFKYMPGSVLYAYCNKHGLWKKEVE